MAAYEWNSTIQNDGADFKLLEPGIYPFTCKAVAKGWHDGSASVPPCPKATVTLRVGVGTEVSDVTENFLLDDSLEWKLCQFFKCIGDRKHGETLKMNWDAVESKSGWVEIENVPGYKDPDKMFNSVARFVDPLEAPADGNPVVKAAQPAEEDDEW